MMEGSGRNEMNYVWAYQGFPFGACKQVIGVDSVDLLCPQEVRQARMEPDQQPAFSVYLCGPYK